MITHDIKITGFNILDESSVDELLENFMSQNTCFEDCLSVKFSFNNLGKPYSCFVKFATKLDRDKCWEAQSGDPPSYKNASGTRTVLTMAKC